MGLSTDFLSTVCECQASHRSVGMLRQLEQIRDTSRVVSNFVLEGGCVDVFTDGSASSPGDPMVRLAAWATTVVAAKAGAEAVVFAKGQVSGIIQTVGRAEILAAIAAPMLSSSQFLSAFGLTISV